MHKGPKSILVWCFLLFWMAVCGIWFASEKHANFPLISQTSGEINLLAHWAQRANGNHETEQYKML